MILATGNSIGAEISPRGGGEGGVLVLFDDGSDITLGAGRVPCAVGDRGGSIWVS